MKQPPKPKNVKLSAPAAQSSGKAENPVNPLLALFFAAVIIPTYTPPFNTPDANGPKFLALSLISIVVVAYLYFTGFFKKYPWFLRGFFTEPPVIAFIALVLLSALSMIKSISISESVDLNKLRYLINDKRYDEAFKLLLEDKSNPWDPRREYFLSWMYDLREQSDSSTWYMRRAMAMNPFKLNMSKITVSIWRIMAKPIQP